VQVKGDIQSEHGPFVESSSGDWSRTRCDACLSTVCREFLCSYRWQASMSSLKSALFRKESERHRPKSLHPRATLWLCCQDPSTNLRRSSQRSAKLVAKRFLCPQMLVSLGVVTSQLASQRAFPQQPASLKSLSRITRLQCPCWSLLGLRVWPNSRV